MMEFVGYDDSISPRRVAYLKAAAGHYLHEPTTEPVVETWTGWRPMTPDSRPLIGLSPALGNVAIAAGHNMLGLSMAPGTGKLVAELLSGQAPHLDPTPFAPVGGVGQNEIPSHAAKVISSVKEACVV